MTNQKKFKPNKIFNSTESISLETEILNGFLTVCIFKTGFASLIITRNGKRYEVLLSGTTENIILSMWDNEAIIQNNTIELKTRELLKELPTIQSEQP
jgi:hypothetical protein